MFPLCVITELFDKSEIFFNFFSWGNLIGGAMFLTKLLFVIFIQILQWPHLRTKTWYLYTSGFIQPNISLWRLNSKVFEFWGNSTRRLTLFDRVHRKRSNKTSSCLSSDYLKRITMRGNCCLGGDSADGALHNVASTSFVRGFMDKWIFTS